MSPGSSFPFKPPQKELRGAIILAGGKSRRMGRNKTFTRFRRTPLLLNVVKKAMTVSDEVNVVIGKHYQTCKYAKILPPSIKILKDVINDHGPLAGISIGLKNLRSKYTSVLPCDLPFINSEVLEYLFRRAEGFDAAIPKWPNGNTEPLHAVYCVPSSLAAAEAALQNNESL